MKLTDIRYKVWVKAEQKLYQAFSINLSTNKVLVSKTDNHKNTYLKVYEANQVEMMEGTRHMDKNGDDIYIGHIITINGKYFEVTKSSQVFDLMYEEEDIKIVGCIYDPKAQTEWINY